MSQRASPKRIATVAKREFIATVSRKGYIATLLLLPLLMAGIAVLPAIAIALAGGTSEIMGLQPPGEISVIGVVDGTGRDIVNDEFLAWHNADQRHADAQERQLPGDEEVIGDKLPEFLKDKQLTDRRDYGGFDGDWRLELRRYDAEDTAREAILSGEAKAVYVFGPDWVETGAVLSLLPERGAMSVALYPGKVAVARLVRKSIAAPTMADKAMLERILRLMETTEETVRDPNAEPEDEGDSGLDKGIAMVLPVLFASFFSLSIFVASGYLLDGIGEEKENKVLEVLLASLTPEELLLGKIVGLGAAGLLQTSVMLVLGLIPMLAMGALSLGFWTIAAMALCAALGYIEYAAVMAASGAVAGNRQEGRQISAVFTLTASSPMFVLPVFMAAADGGVAVFLSLFPPTAPMAMTMRLGLGDVPGWQLAVSVLGMALCGWLSWRLGSRVFRVAILLTGARPPLRRIFEWMRG
ncbi:MAG: ABC transporter permease [Deltaproteobacteria bacterium]|nr:ABC transporter permease [Deltaproteobacteria bacterium]